MKYCKRILGALAIVYSVVAVILFFATKNDPTSALAIATYYPESTTNVDYTVTIAWAISVVCTLAGGVISVLYATSRKHEVVMIVFFAVGFLISLMYSLLYPILLYGAILGFITLMFSVSYSQIENDFNGKL